jgi:SAM-dependent methyltransferase
MTEASKAPSGGSREYRVCAAGGRLVYYRRHMSPAFWDEHWRSAHRANFYLPYLRGYLGRGSLARVLRRRLPKRGRVLEAGCGRGQYVVALRRLGYECLGIDNAKETVAEVRRHFAELPVIRGDVLHLPWKDGSFAAYLSFGVVEHFAAGPGAALREAHRVLADDGLLIISVPQCFPWRRREISELPLTPEFSFYQYAFPAPEFAHLLANSGFRVEEQYGYGSDLALRLRWPAWRRLLALFPRGATALRLLLDAAPYTWQRMAQMRLYVARKQA